MGGNLSAAAIQSRCPLIPRLPFQCWHLSVVVPGADTVQARVCVHEAAETKKVGEKIRGEEHVVLQNDESRKSKAVEEGLEDEPVHWVEGVWGDSRLPVQR